MESAVLSKEVNIVDEGVNAQKTLCIIMVNVSRVNHVPVFIMDNFIMYVYFYVAV